MNFSAGHIYHVYNRGNDKQIIFPQERNYIYFLQKVRKYINPHCDILAWALMPNHFHFMIHANERTELPSVKTLSMNALSEGFRLMLSSYSKGVNKQEGRTGNLMTQNTHAKCVFEPECGVNYVGACFTYIHQNPVRAGIVDDMEKWDYSSYKDYAGLRNGGLCNKELAAVFMDKVTLHTDAFMKISEDGLKNIW